MPLASCRRRSASQRLSIDRPSGGRARNGTHVSVGRVGGHTPSPRASSHEDRPRLGGSPAAAEKRGPYCLAFSEASLSQAVLSPTHFFSSSSSLPDFSQSVTVSDMNLPQGPSSSSVRTARPQGTTGHSGSATTSKLSHFL